MLLTPEASFQGIFDRIASLEQRQTSPEAMGEQDNVFPDGIFIGYQFIDTTLPGAPTGVTVTVGSFGDQSFADISWNVVPLATSYQVEIATKAGTVYSLFDQRQTIGANIRITNLQAGQVYAVRVCGLNSLGLVGPFSVWKDFTAAADSTPPPVLTGLRAFRGASSVIVAFNRSTAADVDRSKGLYTVELSLSPTFATILDSVLTGATAHVFAGQTTQATYYVRAAAIDSSGNQGPWTDPVSTLAGGIVASEHVVAGTIVGDLIAAGEIVTGHMQFGSIDGDRITANTLNVAALEADSVLAKNINLGAGGQFKAGNPPATSGMVINSQGISLYDNTGERTIYLNALGGAATFKGAIKSGSVIEGTHIQGGSISGTYIYGAEITGGVFRTDTQGMYIEIGGSGNQEYIYWHTGDVAEVEPGYAYIWLSGSGGSRQYLLDIKAPTIGGAAGLGASPYLRLGSSMPSSQSARHVILAASAESSLQMSPTGVRIDYPGYFGLWSNGQERLSVEGGLNDITRFYVPGLDNFPTSTILYYDDTQGTGKISIGGLPYPTSNPTNITSGATADTGDSMQFARADHVHGFSGSTGGGGGTDVGVIEFTYYQDTVGIGSSGRWAIRESRQLFEVVASLDVAGTSNTSVRIVNAAGVVGTVTLSSGQTQAVITPNSTFSSGYLKASVVAVGAGAQKLTVQARLKPA